ncbi:hypothetical protein PHEL85_1894 [Polaribacter sp. Hel1_85]|nr:hypothetical protein PHEL85_1894 [Polaribacter sp. Hel1_85]
MFLKIKIYSPEAIFDTSKRIVFKIKSGNYLAITNRTTLKTYK